MCKGSWQYKILTVTENVLTMLEHSIENTISANRATKAHGLREEPASNRDTHHTKKLSQTHTSEANNSEKAQLFVHKIVRTVMKW